jgi:hypothetical protein
MNNPIQRLFVVQHYQVLDSKKQGTDAKFVALERNSNAFFQRFNPWGQYREQHEVAWEAVFAARGLSYADYEASAHDQLFYQFRRRNCATFDVPVTVRFRNNVRCTPQEEAETELIYRRQSQYVVYVEELASLLTEVSESFAADVQRSRWIFEQRDVEVLSRAFPSPLRGPFWQEFIENWTARSFVRISTRTVLTAPPSLS